MTTHRGALPALAAALVGAVLTTSGCGGGAGSATVTKATTTAAAAPGGSTPPSSTAPAGVTPSSVDASSDGGNARGTSHRPARRAVFLVGKDGDGSTEAGQGAPRLRLFREFRELPESSSAGGSGTGAADALAARAVTAAMTDVPAPYLDPWSGRSVQGVRRGADGITITLSPGTGSPVDAETARLAVASLVWTANAAYGGDDPVHFEVPGATTVLGTLPTSQAYRRSAAGTQANELAGIWIDAPGLDQNVAAGQVLAFGQASVYEGTISWQLTRDGATVKHGVATADTAAPERGTWSADLGTLAPGDYVLTASADSPAGKGGVMARTVHPFTVE